MRQLLYEVAKMDRKKRLKFHNEQYQLKVPFMLYADFESILDSVGEQYRAKMNKMKNVRKGKTPNTEKINTHVRSGRSVHSTFIYGDFPDPLKLYRRKDCVKIFLKHFGYDAKQFYTTLLQQSMTQITDVSKREHSLRKMSYLF